MAYRGRDFLAALLGALVLAGFVIAGCQTPKRRTGQPAQEVKGQLTKVRDRLDSLQKKVNSLDRKISMVAASLDRRLTQLEKNSKTSTSSEKPAQEEKAESPRKEMSSRVKELYRPQRPMRSVRVRGLAYDVLRKTLRNASKEGKKKLIKAVKDKVVSWRGWVQKTTSKGQKTKVTVNMYQNPDLYPTATVTFTVPSRIGQQLKEGQKISFTGAIKSVSPEVGSVTLGEAAIRL